MEVKGTIKFIGETKSFGSNGFTKKELVVTTDEQYPQYILIEFHKDKSDLLKNNKIGDGVIVGINLRGKEWTNPQGEVKYFNTLIGWKIDPIPFDSSKTPSQQHIANQVPTATPQEAFEPAEDTNEEEEDSGLPF